MGRGKDVGFGQAPKTHHSYFPVLLRALGARNWPGCSQTSSLGEAFNGLFSVNVSLDTPDISVHQKNPTWGTRKPVFSGIDQ